MSFLKNRYTTSLKNYFQTFLYKSALPFHDDWFKEIIFEREKRHISIVDWWDEELLKNSIFQYGIVDEVKPLLNLPLGNSPTYSDLIVYCIQLLQNKVHYSIEYLELGVSVGKNFFNVIEAVNNTKVAGFEIEKINPKLEKLLSFKEMEVWDTMRTSIKKDSSTLSIYTKNTNTIKYLSGDIWDTSSWERLKNSKYNVIFSDAFHSKDALLHEFSMISRYNLLGDQFVIIWDDLFFDLKDGFLEINRQMRREQKFKDINCYLIQINGWLGENWSKHPVGIITNFF